MVGGGVIRTIGQKKAMTTLFFSVVLKLFTEAFNVFFIEELYISKVPEEVHQFTKGGGRGGDQLFPRGSNCLFPIETHLICGFPGGPDPLPSSGSTHAFVRDFRIYHKIGYITMLQATLCTYLSYTRQKRNAPLRTVQLSGKSKVIGQFSLYQCKGISVTAASHFFCNQASKLC